MRQFLRNIRILTANLAVEFVRILKSAQLYLNYLSPDVSHLLALFVRATTPHWEDDVASRNIGENVAIFSHDCQAKKSGRPFSPMIGEH